MNDNMHTYLHLQMFTTQDRCQQTIYRHAPKFAQAATLFDVLSSRTTQPTEAVTSRTHGTEIT